MRRLMLALSVTCLTATPGAFAHNHHASAYAGNSPSRSSSHAGFGRHGFANADRANARSDNPSNQNQSVADASNPRKHQRVPDEEELAQPEQ